MFLNDFYAGFRSVSMIHKFTVLDLQIPHSRRQVPRSGFLVGRVVLEVESRDGVVTSTLGETFPLKDLPRVFRIPQTSLQRK